MPYTNNSGQIDLNDYKLVRNLTSGMSCQVALWENKNNSELKIVVKTPHIQNSAFVAHNIRTINAFFGENSAWTVAPKSEGKPAFAMKYYEGQKLAEGDFEQLLPSLKTITKGESLFTMLDPNCDNFIKLSDGEIVPIDFDYMIMHDDHALLPYQKTYLNQRMSFRMGCCDGMLKKDAVKNVIETYPQAAALLLRELWVDDNVSVSIMQPCTAKISSTEQKFDVKIALIKIKMQQFKSNNNNEALMATTKLCKALSAEGKKYFTSSQTLEDYRTFNTNCHAAILEARKELDKHRGWTKIVLNILAFVGTLGVGYGIAAGINVAVNKGRFTFFATDSSLKLNKIEDYIESISPKATLALTHQIT